MSDALRALGRAGDGANATREGLGGLLPLLRQRPEIFQDLATMLAREHLEAAQEAGQTPDGELLLQVDKVLGIKDKGVS
jgi:hypothetical protein